MRNTTRSAALERRFPYLCKVLYFPDNGSETARSAPANQLNWYLRSSMMPRVGDVIPYGQSLFSVNTVILEDCCSADAVSKVDKQASRAAERDEIPKWHAVVWGELLGREVYLN